MNTGQVENIKETFILHIPVTGKSAASEVEIYTLMIMIIYRQYIYNDTLIFSIRSYCFCRDTSLYADPAVTAVVDHF